MIDILARILFVVIVIGWYFYVRNRIYWFITTKEREAPSPFLTVFTYGLALPFTGLSVLAAFGVLMAAKWVWYGTV